MLYYGYKNAIFDLTELVNKTLEFSESSENRFPYTVLVSSLYR